VQNLKLFIVRTDYFFDLLQPKKVLARNIAIKLLLLGNRCFDFPSVLILFQSIDNLMLKVGRCVLKIPQMTVTHLGSTV